MTAAVRRLVRRFEIALRAAAIAELLGKLETAPRRRVAGARARSAPRSAAPIRPKHSRRRRRRRALVLRKARERLHLSPAVTSTAGPPLEPRAVVVRIDGTPSRIALLEAAPAPGFYRVRLAKRRGKYSAKRRVITAGELIRDATARELELGYVVPGVTS